MEVQLEFQAKERLSSVIYEDAITQDIAANQGNNRRPQLLAIATQIRPKDSSELAGRNRSFRK